MDDKNLMEGMLLLEKGVCDLYMHGTMEAPTDNVRSAFSAALNESLCMQDTLYSKIVQTGCYPPAHADQTPLTTVTQNHSAAQ